MNNLERILDKIKTDATKKSQDIIEDKKRERQEFIDQKTSEAEDKAKRIIRNAEEKRDIILRNASTQADRRRRDIELFAKNDVVKKVLDLTVERLKNMDKKDYERFVKNSLKNLSPEDGKLLLQKSMDKNDFDFGDFEISKETVDEGFALKKGNILYDNKFSSLVDYNKNEYEKIIIEKLFN
ncbi:MAG: V-type ATP synthase subunit E [Tissierellia bacterium]|nr:V-type ATP synthase subunit E [Tissierellia bacterium]